MVIAEGDPIPLPVNENLVSTVVLDGVHPGWPHPGGIRNIAAPTWSATNTPPRESTASPETPANCPHVAGAESAAPVVPSTWIARTY